MGNSQARRSKTHARSSPSSQELLETLDNKKAFEASLNTAMAMHIARGDRRG